jgi:RNA polymerase sigma-70 factor (ECF subfamily)
MQKEKDFIQAATNGDVEAFSWLVKKYRNALYSVAYSVVGDFHFAQDIAQEAFIKSYLNLTKLQSPDKFGSWIYP